MGRLEGKRMTVETHIGEEVEGSDWEVCDSCVLRLSADPPLHMVQ